MNWVRVLACAGLAVPAAFGAIQITSPAEAQSIGVTNVTFQWTEEAGSSGYDLTVLRAGGQTVFSGKLAGSSSTSVVLNLPEGSLTFQIRSCTGSSLTVCSAPVSRNFSIQTQAPALAPQIVSPGSGQLFSTSTQQFRWNSVAGATQYQVTLRNNTAGTVDLFIATAPPDTQTIFSMRSGQYTLEVRACTVSCGPPGTVDFRVQLPPVPNAAPTVSSCPVSNQNRQNSLTCNWSAVSGADLYIMRAVQPAPAGPGGGALTVASRQVSSLSATALVPNGAAFVFVQACNGDGCGPQSAPFAINPAFGNPSAPVLGDPVGGLTVDGPTLTLSWSRIPGDDGQNTWYRLYIQDFSRQQPALDVLTRDNYYGAQFAAGRRYDALVIALPDTTAPVQGPAQGFTTRGASPNSPTLVQPRHSSTIPQGNTRLSWTPIPAAQLYQYYISREGGAIAANGVTTGLEVQVPLQAAGGLDTGHIGIVRVCNNGLNCTAASNSGWGPWSNEPGNSGVTNFTVSTAAPQPVSPVISQVLPNFAAAGTSNLAVQIAGVNTHFAQGSTVADLGAGITVTGVAVTNPRNATLTLSIAAGASGLRNVTLISGGETVTLPNGFNIGGTAAAPAVSDFSPKSGPPGTLVTVSGSNFQPGSAAVLLARQGGGSIDVATTSITATQLSFVIPPGAATGTLAVAVRGLSGAAATPLTVTPSSSFSVTAAPGATSLIRGQSVALSVKVDSSNGFSQLASLAVSGLPSGVTGAFSPRQIAPGQTSILTFTAPAGQPVSTNNLSISASAPVDGINVTQSASAQLSVVAPTTTLIGRTVVDDPLQTPISGVRITMLGRDGNGGNTGCSGSTQSDSAGNFALTNLSASCVGRQLVGFDGAATTSPAGKYAGVNLAFILSSGQVTASPVLVHLPRIDDKETVMIRQNFGSNQTFSFATMPGVSIIVYAGTTITAPDGSRPDPFPLTAVPVPFDRLPDFKPPVATMIIGYYISFSPATSRASRPVAVYYPNTLNTRPGSSVTLLSLDPSRGNMVPYGTGTIAANGSQIVPDPDPQYPGARYGLVNFDWHGGAPAPPPRAAVSPKATPEVPAGGPVDLSTGLEAFSTVDIELRNPLMPVVFERFYRNSSPEAGPFGPGTGHRYSFRLDTTTPISAQLIELILPTNKRVPFNRQPDGTFVNVGEPSFAGAVIRVATDGIATLRGKHGSYMRFEPSTGFNGSLLAAIGDRFGNEITIVRDPANVLEITAIKDPAGRQLRINYQGGLVSTVSDPIGRRVTYTYSQGRLATVTKADGSVFRYGYTPDGNLSDSTDPRGNKVIQNSYDADGRVTQQTYADGTTMQLAYTLLNPMAPTGPVQNVVHRDARGNSTTLRFNAQGFLTQAQDALGQTQSTLRQDGTNLPARRQGNGLCRWCTAASAGDTSAVFDPRGNVLTTTDANGNSSAFAYEQNFSDLASVTDPSGAVTQMSYDTAGNLTSIRDARGNVSRFTFNPAGQVLTKLDASGSTRTSEYDSFGNLIATVDPTGNRTRFVYDPAYRLIAVIDARSRRTQFVYDPMDRVIATIDPAGRRTQFTFDANGNMTQLIDPKGQSTSFVYDVMNRLTRRTDPGGRSETFSYDSEGNLTSSTDRRGRISTFTYDALNRLVTEAYAGGATVVRSYDDRGRLSRVEDSEGGTFEYSYDAAGRLLRSSGPTGTVTYTRDRLGRMASRQVAGYGKVDYEYDPAGNVSRLAMPGASVTIAYDSRNLPVSLARSNGVTTAISYDAAGRIVTMTHSRGATVLRSQTYTFDAAGQKSAIADPGSSAFVTSAATGSYDGANRMTAFGGRSFGYDQNGNTVTDNRQGSAASYVWDSRNRLASVTVNGVETRLSYDFAGNLLRISRGAGSSAQTTSFVLDLITNVVAQTDGTTQQALLTGPAIDQHYAVIDNAGVRFGLTDALGSVIGVAGSGGTLDGQASYDPFGNPTSSGASFPFGFTGRNQLTSGLLHYRARYYDPSAGRFLSEDPGVFSGGDANLYRYTRNQPEQLVDPDGRRAGLVLVAVAVNAVAGGLSAGLDAYECGEGWGAIAGKAAAGAASDAIVAAYAEAHYIAAVTHSAANNLFLAGVGVKSSRAAAADFIGDVATPPSVGKGLAKLGRRAVGQALTSPIAEKVVEQLGNKLASMAVADLVKGSSSGCPEKFGPPAPVQK